MNMKDVKTKELVFYVSIPKIIVSDSPCLQFHFERGRNKKIYTGCPCIHAPAFKGTCIWY